MSWWWAGAVGAARKRQNQHAVALVVGSTGIVGSSLLDILPREDTPGGPWKVYALSRRPPPSWLPPSSPSVTHLQVDLGGIDLTDPAAVADAIQPLKDVTHVFYAAWSLRPTEAGNREVNSAMLRSVLSEVVAGCPALAHVCLQTGRKHYLGPFDAVGNISGAPEPPYIKDMPRLHHPNFYYDQEDVLLRELSRRDGAVSWSVHRPTLIFGFSPRSAMNVVSTLCVYASICRKEGATLRWPGSRVVWEGFSDASDADLIAEQEIWAAVDPNAKNQAFNCTNGDVFKWKQLWPMLARRIGVEWAGYEGEDSRFNLAEAMPGKEPVWTQILQENDQLVSTKLEDIANWWLVDTMFSFQFQHLDTMNKSKEHGFFGFRNTVKSFNTWIDKMILAKIVPN